MVTAETANKWIEDAYADERLKAIIAEVEKTYEIGVAIFEGPEWECEAKGTRAVIRIADTSRPLSAFAHELLHLRLAARGYRHIRANANHDPEINLRAASLISALDNELQHHRMFPDFVSAGFDGRDFYAESDDGALADVKAMVEAIDHQNPPSGVLLTYLTLIAPGGRWPDGSCDALMELLRTKVLPETWEKLLAIKATIEAWRNQDILDPIETIASIFETLGDLNGTFIGESPNSYPVGAFIPRSLTKEQFEKLVNG